MQSVSILSRNLNSSSESKSSGEVPEPLEYTKKNLQIRISPDCFFEIQNLIKNSLCLTGPIIDINLSLIDETNSEAESIEPTPSPLNDTDIDSAVVEFLGDGIALIASNKHSEQNILIKIEDLRDWNNQVFTQVNQSNLDLDERIESLRFILGNKSLSDKACDSLSQDPTISSEKILNLAGSCGDPSIVDQLYLRAIQKDVDTYYYNLDKIRDESICLDAYKAIIDHFYDAYKTNCTGLFYQKIECFLKNSAPKLISDVLQYIFEREFQLTEGEAGEDLILSELLGRYFLKIDPAERETVLFSILTKQSFPRKFCITAIKKWIENPDLAEHLIQNIDNIPHNRFSKTKSANNIS